MFYDYPFTRLIVFNSVSDTTYVQWDLDPRFEDRGPYYFQLQVSRSPDQQSDDWQNVGSVEVDPAFLTDDTTPSYGYALDKYYRIVLDTAEGHYVSLPFGCFGQLRPREWQQAREIRRKERLRYRYTAVPVTILQKKRYGERCPACTSGEDSGTSNSNCEYCFGTGYLGGYNTPFTMQVMDISPSRLREIHYSNGVATSNIAQDRYQARAAGVPELYNGDIIIDHSTDQRFRVVASPVIAQMHRVPLVRQVDMYLLPFSDIVYRIPKALKQPTIGCGAVKINENYPSEGDLMYVNSENAPIISATVDILSLDDTILFSCKTLADGRWSKAYMADPGVYRVRFTDSDGAVGHTVEIVIEEEKALEDETYKETQAIEKIDYLRGFG